MMSTSANTVTENAEMNIDSVPTENPQPPASGRTCRAITSLPATSNMTDAMPKSHSHPSLLEKSSQHQPDEEQLHRRASGRNEYLTREAERRGVAQYRERHHQRRRQGEIERRERYGSHYAYQVSTSRPSRSVS